MDVNTVSGILYEVKAKAIIEALVDKVENKTLGERLAEVEAKVTVSDRLEALEVDILGVVAGFVFRHFTRCKVKSFISP